MKDEAQHKYIFLCIIGVCLFFVSLSCYVTSDNYRYRNIIKEIKLAPYGENIIKVDISTYVSTNFKIIIKPYSLTDEETQELGENIKSVIDRNLLIQADKFYEVIKINIIEMYGNGTGRSCYSNGRMNNGEWEK